MLANAFSPVWILPPDDHLLEAGQVHIWRVDLDQAGDCLDDLQSTLSADELERAGRFQFERNRRRFITGRGELRRLLGRYLREEPGALRFQYGARGKPSLEVAAARGLCFNLAHTQEIALYAFSDGIELGIDLERVRPLEDADQIVGRYFSPEEKLAYAALNQPEEKQRVFFQAWTRKEAFLKATGEGLALELDQVVVSLGPQEPARFLRLPARYHPLSAWQLVDLEPGLDCCAALAVHGAARQISYWQWSEQVDR